MMVSQTHTKEDLIRQRTYWLSLLVSIALLIIKFWAYQVTKSQAVFSDALESIINVLTPVVGIIALYAASKPADEEHPYGHGKVEYFSSAFEGGLILFAAVMIVAEAVKALLDGHQPGRLEEGVLLVSLSAVINFGLGYYVLKIGEKHHSAALRANGKHILSDVWTTAGVVLGLFAVKVTGIVWLDILAALVVGVLLGIDGIKVVIESAGGLMDAEDKSLTQAVADLFTKHRKTGVIHIHHTRVMRSGRYHHIDSHVVLPEYWNVEKAHNEMQDYENKVIRDYPVDGEVHFHLDPCRRAYCKVCDDNECPIRKEKFNSLMPITVESLTHPLEPEEYRRK